MGELDRDEDFIVTLKHRPFEAGYSGTVDLRSFVAGIDSATPYLEQQDILGQSSGIFAINGATAKDAFKRAEFTVIYVAAPNCHGCKLMEPLLPKLDERIQM